MTQINEYFLERLASHNLDINRKQYSDITEHLWSQDGFSKGIRSFIFTNNRRQPIIFETDEIIIKSILPSITAKIEYEGIGFITLEDVVAITTGMQINEFGKQYEQKKDQIWVAYMGLIVQDKMHLVSGYMINTLYIDFDKQVTMIDANTN